MPGAGGFGAEIWAVAMPKTLRHKGNFRNEADIEGAYGRSKPCPVVEVTGTVTAYSRPPPGGQSRECVDVRAEARLGKSWRNHRDCCKGFDRSR